MTGLAAAGALPPHLRFRSGVGEHLFVTAYSRLYDLAPDDLQTFDPNADFLEALGRPGEEDVPLDRPAFPAPQAISLNVSAACNLACGYCFAGQGGFGGKQPAGMSWEVARAAIDRLLDAADPAHPVTIGFMGGEPFLNRPLIHQSMEHASAAGAARALDVRFSVTTNGTLVRSGDVALLRRHPVAVTVSIDGDAETHDEQRPQAGGRGSWKRAVEAMRPLLADPGLAKVGARATVTRRSAPLARMFDALVAAGFREIGFSPLRTGPEAAGPILGDNWIWYLDQLIGLAKGQLAEIRAGRATRLTNFAVALKQIHRGACSPYPCGAGGGYFSVGHDGDWYACHRAIGEEAFRLGDNSGLDDRRRADFLTQRHVDAQTDCRSCWARYLCSGGCHHEATARTAQSCDFVRGWLQFCLASYCELSELHRRLVEREETIRA